MKHIPFESEQQMKLAYRALRVRLDVSSLRARLAWKLVGAFRARAQGLPCGRTFARFLEGVCLTKFGHEPCLAINTRSHRRPFKPAAPVRKPLYADWRLNPREPAKTLRGYRATGFY